MTKLYNTLGRKLENFKPLKAGQVKLYTCGPTVYDYAQLGNLRAFVFDDTLRRMLSATGFDVKHVMNITDVGHLVSDEDEGEDKLEKGAKREGKSVWQVADHYIEAFVNDMAELNVLPPNGYKNKSGVYARATDFIAEQIELVKLLLDKGYAYQTEQAIYFDISKLKDYGKLTGQKLSDKEIGARSDVVTDKAKHHPQDFALWFFTVGRFKDHEMHWDSPWGQGFPGWHLECSAIIHATLGEPIDVHTGGVDHIGTHHTNEIAQSEAAYGKPLANYWLHNEFLLVDGQRMAKSAGNFFTLKDIKDKNYDPLALRLLFLQSHYRSQVNFTWEALAAAQTFLNRLRGWADLIFQPQLGHHAGAGSDYDKALENIKRFVSDDLHTAEALAVVAKLVDQSEKVGVDITKLKSLLAELDKLFGLSLSERRDLTDTDKKLLSERQEARTANDWAEADRLRHQLSHSQIEVQDTPHGQVWRRLAK